MTTLSRSYPLTFLGNIIKNKVVGNGSIAAKIEESIEVKDAGDALMRDLVRAIKSKNDIYLKQQSVTLPITLSLIKKYTRHDDIMFNRICLMRLLFVCNYMLQANEVASDVTCEANDDNDILDRMSKMSLSSNAEVVRAINDADTRNIAGLDAVKSAIKTEIQNLGVKNRNAIEEAKRELKETIELASNKQVKILNTMKEERASEKKAPLPLQKKQMDTGKSVASKDEVSQFEDKNIELVEQIKNNLFRVKIKGKKKRILNEENLSMADKDLLNSIIAKDGKISNPSTPKSDEEKSDEEKSSGDDEETKKTDEMKTPAKGPKVRATLLKSPEGRATLAQRPIGERGEVSKVKGKVNSARKLFQNSSDNKQDQQDEQDQDEEDDEDANEIYGYFDVYSDDFEAASDDLSRMPFLKIVFEDFGMKGVTHVTDACIQYLYNGMQMNKGNYKKNYKSFYKCFIMKEMKVTEKDAEVMKHLFANVHDVDFDHDYLCMIGNDLRMKWISYLRLAFYEKYIFFHMFTRKRCEINQGCILESLDNFVYDYCYLATLMFENC